MDPPLLVTHCLRCTTHTDSSDFYKYSTYVWPSLSLPFPPPGGTKWKVKEIRFLIFYFPFHIAGQHSTVVANPWLPVYFVPGMEFCHAHLKAQRIIILVKQFKDLCWVIHLRSKSLRKSLKTSLTNLKMSILLKKCSCTHYGVATDTIVIHNFYAVLLGNESRIKGNVKMEEIVFKFQHYCCRNVERATTILCCHCCDCYPRWK